MQSYIAPPYLSCDKCHQCLIAQNEKAGPGVGGLSEMQTKSLNQYWFKNINGLVDIHVFKM